jgi:hypothetical protein
MTPLRLWICFNFRRTDVDEWDVMLTYRGFRIERVILHSNSGRLHRHPSGMIGIRPFQSIKYAILERVVADHWEEVASAPDDAAALVLVDEIMRSRQEQNEGSACA